MADYYEYDEGPRLSRVWIVILLIALAMWFGLGYWLWRLLT